MKREFNTTGLCVPNRHYMVDVSGKLSKIKELIENSKYFTINRGRQYGKTTTLALLKKMLRDEYIVASISFEGLDETHFSTHEAFCGIFMRLISRNLKFSSAKQKYINKWINTQVTDFDSLSIHISEMCKNHKVVLFIDEVDKTSNNVIFLNFLSILRSKYLNFINGEDNTFHSVVLAGVYDIKNIKLKLIKQGSYTLKESEGTYNSPWNIAIDFNVDMSFIPGEIATMLRDYEEDYHTGMDIDSVSKKIHEYTNGYPFLVSKLCKIIDGELDRNWTNQGVVDAVKILMYNDNTLFDDIFKNLENNDELYQLIYDILMVGKGRTYSKGNPAVNLALLYGIIMESDGKVTVANRIFELIIGDYFISKDEGRKDRKFARVLQYDLVHDGSFDMASCLEKFAAHYREMYSDRDVEFLERHGRMLFITYLRPLINGQGFYHIESGLTDLRRMDLVVDFNNEQFIIELKLWYGEAEHQRAYGQLKGYLDNKNMDKGYLLTFDFRKEKNKDYKAEWVNYLGKDIFDVIC